MATSGVSVAKDGTPYFLNVPVGSTTSYRRDGSTWGFPSADAGYFNISGDVFSGDASLSDFDKYMQLVADNSEKNNVWSAKQAEILRDWQVQQNQLAMIYNSSEAAKNRDWQKMMSDTAHQREVADLKAAGLNPVLSAMGGNGAAVTSGATASGVTSSGAKGDTDTSANSAIVGLLSSFLSAQVNLEAQRVSAQTNLAVADKYNAMSKYAADLSAQTQLTTANINTVSQQYIAHLQSATSLSVAEKNAQASKVAASIHAAAAKYGYDVSAMTQRQISAFNAEVNKDLKQMDIDSKFDLEEAFPSSPYGLMNSFIGQLTGENGFTGIGSIGSGVRKFLSADLKDVLHGTWNSSGGFGTRQGGFGSK